MGLYQLIKSAYSLEILQRNGVIFSRDQILQEQERMFKNSKNPQLLEQVRQIFGDNEEAYLRAFVLPNLADHFIYYDFFLNDPSVHKESLAKARHFLETAQKADKRDFLRTASENNLQPKTLKLSLKKGLQWGDSEKQKKPEALPKEYTQFVPDQTQEALVWYERVVKLLNPGGIFPEPLSLDDNWVVVRYAKKEQDDEYHLEVVFFQKAEFNSWIQKEKEKIKIEVKDASLLPKLPF